MKFKIGDKVKFKDYSKFSDHKFHEGQTGEVTHLYGDSINVIWKDGNTSRATFSDITKPYKVVCKDIDSKLFKI